MHHEVSKPMRALALGLLVAQGAALAARDGPPLPKQASDPAVMGAWVFVQYSAPVIKTALAAQRCNLRGPEWGSYLVGSLQVEFAMKMAAFRREAKDPEAFDATRQDLTDWWRGSMVERAPGEACSEVAQSDALRIADTVFFRLQRESALMR